MKTEKQIKEKINELKKSVEGLKHLAERSSDTALYSFVAMSTLKVMQNVQDKITALEWCLEDDEASAKSQSDIRLMDIIKANLDWFKSEGIDQTIKIMNKQGRISTSDIIRVKELYLMYMYNEGRIQIK